MNVRRVLSAASIGVIGMAIMAGMARADAVMGLESRNLETGDVTAYRIATGDGNVSLSVTEGGNGLFDFMYRPGQDDVLIIDHDARRVQQLSEQMLRAMQTMEGGPQGNVGTSGAAQRRMSESLRGLPPEERARARKKTGQNSGDGDSLSDFAPEARRTGQMAEIAGVQCEVVEMIRRGQKISELCLADPASIDGGEEMVAAMRDMSAFYEDFSETLPPETPAELSMRLQPFDGQFPVRIRRFENGQAVSEMVLTQASAESQNSATFEAPADYERGLVR